MPLTLGNKVVSQIFHVGRSDFRPAGRISRENYADLVLILWRQLRIRPGQRSLSFLQISIHVPRLVKLSPRVWDFYVDVRIYRLPGIYIRDPDIYPIEWWSCFQPSRSNNRKNYFHEYHHGLQITESRTGKRTDILSTLCLLSAILYLCLW